MTDPLQVPLRSRPGRRVAFKGQRRTICLVTEVKRTCNGELRFLPPASGRVRFVFDRGAGSRGASSVNTIDDKSRSFET